MKKPHGGIDMNVEYNKHLRSGSKSGHKRSSMSRFYWGKWRAKAKADLDKKRRSAVDEMNEDKEES